ncbi:RidA family protein [Hyphococcus flavus]|uniref:RidA family protein n=1 Tax=Hyphococcus flavus TaxID=1866326 RepID=A0AAE9ZB82_9PROT|nr:RidA family protein [Hyphococcus flavus]WDI31358.1 RidA family protein [Hyphococcus flavus]
MTAIDEKLVELGIILPEPASPVANYVPYVVSGKEVFISGQVSIGPDGLITGKLGRDLNLEKGIEAAHACGVNLIAQLKAACEGDLSRVKRVVKLGAFVNCTDEFYDQPKVVNGASDLMVAVFGDAGRHARAAVGAPSLPLNAAVEVDGIFEID